MPSVSPRQHALKTNGAYDKRRTTGKQPLRPHERHCREVRLAALSSNRDQRMCPLRAWLRVTVASQVTAAGGHCRRRIESLARANLLAVVRLRFDRRWTARGADLAMSSHIILLAVQPSSSEKTAKVADSALAERREHVPRRTDADPCTAASCGHDGGGRPHSRRSSRGLPKNLAAIAWTFALLGKCQNMARHGDPGRAPGCIRRR